MTHRAPWECTFAKEEPSRCLPGKRPRTDREYVEILSLCILQAGLSWAGVRSSWPRYRRAFFAREFERIREEHGTFGRYLRTVKSDKEACAMLQERFRHVGPYTAEFYLHCVGHSVYGS
ncbi:MAG TPA: hypothetical protein VFE48_05125 [Methylomirabilota bacterium]|nr:hypothetical protein [Methylomirabilota bacterium]